MIERDKWLNETLGFDVEAARRLIAVGKQQEQLGEQPLAKPHQDVIDANIRYEGQLNEIEQVIARDRRELAAAQDNPEKLQLVQ